GATAEPGEPILPGQRSPASRWWKWVASETGELWISGAAAVGAFTGEQLSTLTLKTNGTGSLVVPVEAGTTYYFEAASTNPPPSGLIVVVWGGPDPDPCSLRWPFGASRFAWRHANDDFENRKL